MKSWDWTDWLLEVWGAVGERKLELGTEDALSDWETLISIFGSVEYCVSNAGDFENMEVLNPNFQSDAVRISDKLGLTQTKKMFSLNEASLLEEFEDLFDDVCAEIANYIEMLPESGNVGNVSKLWAEKCSKKSL